MAKRLFFILVITVGFSACRSNDMRCPDPQVVKLKKSSAYKFLVFDKKQKEKVMAQSNSYARENKRDVRHKEVKDMEEWDCPRPGSIQDRANQKRLKRLQKNAESNPRKVNTTPVDGTPAHAH